MDEPHRVKRRRKRRGGKVPGGKAARRIDRRARGGGLPETPKHDGIGGHVRAGITQPTKPLAEARTMQDPMDWRPKRAKGGGIHIKPSHKGRLHEDTHTPAGKHIPEKKLEAAKRSEDPKVREEATFAENAKHWRH